METLWAIIAGIGYFMAIIAIIAMIWMIRDNKKRKNGTFIK